MSREIPNILYEWATVINISYKQTTPTESYSGLPTYLTESSADVSVVHHGWFIAIKVNIISSLYLGISNQSMLMVESKG